MKKKNILHCMRLKLVPHFIVKMCFFYPFTYDTLLLAKLVPVSTKNEHCLKIRERNVV